MSEVKTRENGFNEEVINSFRNGIPENWRDMILKHHVALSSIPVESSMKFQDPPKETESKVEEKEPLNRDVSKPKRQTKKLKKDQAYVSSTNKLETPESLTDCIRAFIERTK